jgi:UDP-N-acetylmuramate dehydrogenase
MHANFIVNTGDAKAADVLGLIALIKKKIKELHNIDIETEVEIIGRQS